MERRPCGSSAFECFQCSPASHPLRGLIGSLALSFGKFHFEFCSGGQIKSKPERESRNRMHGGLVENYTWAILVEVVHVVCYRSHPMSSSLSAATAVQLT